MAGIYKGQNFDLDNFKLNNKLKCKEVPIEDISAAIKRICFYYKKSRMEDNTYFNENLPSDIVEKDAFQLIKSPNINIKAMKKPPLHANPDSERIKSDLRNLYRKNKISKSKIPKRPRIQEEESPCGSKNQTKHHSITDSAKDGERTTMLDRYKSVQRGSESAINSSNQMSTKQFILSDLKKPRVHSEGKIRPDPSALLGNPDQTEKALQYLVNISDKLQTLNGTLEKLKEENNALKKLDERKLENETEELPQLKSIAGDKKKHVVKKKNPLRYRIDRPKNGKLQIKKVDASKLRSPNMKVSDLGRVKA